jgi:hypothetical protein
LICNNFNLNFIFGIVCIFVCVCAFSLRRESPDMIFGDKPLISEGVLSQTGPPPRHGSTTSPHHLTSKRCLPILHTCLKMKCAPAWGGRWMPHSRGHVAYRLWSGLVVGQSWRIQVVVTRRAFPSRLSCRVDKCSAVGSWSAREFHSIIGSRHHCLGWRLMAFSTWCRFG